MKLSPESIISKNKLTRYLLKYLSQGDKSKFLARAGYTEDNWQVLENAIRAQILPLEATAINSDQFGERFEIRSKLIGINGHVLEIVTIWMIEKETEKTKFITLFPNKELTL